MPNITLPLARIFVFWLTLPLVMSLSATSMRFGCVPHSADPWFIEQRSATAAAPVPGVTIEPLTTDGQRLLIRNISTTPLYLLQPNRRGSEDRLHDPHLPLPDTFVTNVKIVADEVIVMDSLKRWKPLRDMRGNDYWDSNGTGNQTFEVTSLGAYFPSLSWYGPTGDDRPENVAIPPPRQADLHMLYGDRLISTPIYTTTYALNPDYDPQRQAKEADDCKHGNAFIMLTFSLFYLIPYLPLVFAIVCFMLAILFLMYALARYRKLN